MGILQLSPVSLLTGKTRFCLLQFSLHPTCLYVCPSVWWKCMFKVDPITMNPVFNHVHMCYLHLRFSFGHSVTLWSLETRACGHEVICGPTLSLMDSLCMWQRWFTRGPGRRCERKCFIPVEGKKIATRLQRVHIHLRFMGWIIYCASKIQNGWTGYVRVDSLWTN